MTCSVPDCEKPVFVVARGLCKYHYGRWARGAPLVKVPRNYLAAFVQKLDKQDPSGCWPYMGGVDPDGYGIFSASGKPVRAHRYAYAHLIGRIPKGLQVCHRCDNPPCCNPGHLFLGTNLDNSLDMMAKGRWGGSPTTKLTKQQVLEILHQRPLPRSEIAAGIASMYGISAATVMAIWRSDDIARGYAKRRDDQLLALTNAMLAQLAPEVA